MNSKKKVRTLLHSSSSTNSQDTTPKSLSKHNLLGSCRRVGLSRKRTKSLGVSPTVSPVNPIEVASKNTEVQINIEQKSETTIRKPKVGNIKRKRKVDSDEERTMFSDNAHTFSQETEKVKDTKDSKNESSASVKTIPVSINLTRCDLNALKLNLTSPKHKNVQSLANIDEKIPQPPAEPQELFVEESQTQSQSESSVLRQNNSLEENSDGSDFYPNVTRRKKKKVLTTKQRNFSKPGPSQQKENTPKSANNTPCYSDSDDDFVATPVRGWKSVKSENNTQNSQSSQNSLEEKVQKKKLKLKMKKPVEDELNKTGHIRISENKSYTIIHRDNCVSYVKSFDNDVNFKVTESDDNQQPPRNLVEMPKKTMIIERKDYITERQSSSSENAEILMDMPSIFTDIINNIDDPKYQYIPEEKPENNNESSKKIPQFINVIETSKLQKNKTFDEPKQQQSETSENKPTPSESSSSVETSESENNSEASVDSKTTKAPLKQLNVKQLTDELATLEASIKKKQERIQSLQRISVYKETHNLEELRALTLRIKRGCQSALVDLVLSLKEQSHANFTMATLLEFMKIPNELVGYNEEDDNFI